MKLEVLNLKKKFGEKEVLKNINFTFESGKIYGLLGRNGAGKTTFFNCLNEDILPDEGTFNIVTESSRPLTIDDIGYVLSTPVVPEFLTGREFLKFFLEINEGKIKNEKTIDEYFDFMKIEEEDRDKLLKDYSHGMKNKMQMLINIIASPNILLLDEPLTSALDPISTSKIEELAIDLKKRYTIIIVTHNMQQAVRISDYTSFFLLGELIETGETEKLFSKPVDKRTEDYITGRFG